MAHAAARGLPQPDFEVIAQSHRDLASELTKCGNIPAFDAGRAILAAIQEVKDEISGLKNQLKATLVDSLTFHIIAFG
jgi:hypothetical protein